MSYHVFEVDAGQKIAHIGPKGDALLYPCLRKMTVSIARPKVPLYAWGRPSKPVRYQYGKQGIAGTLFFNTSKFWTPKEGQLHALVVFKQDGGRLMRCGVRGVDFLTPFDITGPDTAEITYVAESFFGWEECLPWDGFLTTATRPNLEVMGQLLDFDDPAERRRRKGRLLCHRIARDLTSNLSKLLRMPMDDLYDPAMELVAETMRNYERFSSVRRWKVRRDGDVVRIDFAVSALTTEREVIEIDLSELAPYNEVPHHNKEDVIANQARLPGYRRIDEVDIVQDALKLQKLEEARVKMAIDHALPLTDPSRSRQARSYDPLNDLFEMYETLVQKHGFPSILELDPMLAPLKLNWKAPVESYFDLMLHEEEGVIRFVESMDKCFIFIAGDWVEVRAPLLRRD